MELFTAPGPMRAWSLGQRGAGRSVAVVPTMGALHAGHLALVAEAQRRADVVIVTIFVNPLQFDRNTDFDTYPRTIDADLDACRAVGVDAAYAPSAATMYPPGSQTTVAPGALADTLEGAMRPGHYRGVTTVVAKLFGATAPDIAVFGQKDYQQLTIVRRMVTDLDMGVEIVGVATAREADGLARSSRNVRLTPDDRAAAVAIPDALRAASVRYADGERDAGVLQSIAWKHLGAEPRARVEYVAVVDAEDLTPLATVDGPAVILAAVWFGDVRLIDNQLLG